ncbi:MAG: hypothetical protein VB934_03085 [Polyangiaceae bacterium]
MKFDESGWLIGRATPWLVSDCYSLFSPDVSSRVDCGRWTAQAARFFDASVEVTPQKRYPENGEPIRDALQLHVSFAGATAEVSVQTLPLEDAHSLFTAAEGAVARMGGAGFDVLLGRARRLWQVRIDGEPRAASLVTALLASVWLAPVLPPDQSCMFGVKGARQRFEALTPCR